MMIMKETVGGEAIKHKQYATPELFVQGLELLQSCIG